MQLQVISHIYLQYPAIWRKAMLFFKVKRLDKQENEPDITNLND